MPPIEQFHPLAVHFPIVIVLSLAAFDLIAGVRGYEISGRGPVANVSAGLATLAGLAALVAFVFGDIAFDIAMERGAPSAPLEVHEQFGTITTSVIVIWSLIRAAAWWRQVPIAGGRKVAAIVVEISIAALIVATAYFGGRLVYEFGVGVSRTIGG